MQLSIPTVTLLLLTLGVFYCDAQAPLCDCIDAQPPTGRSCAEHRARGECSRRWMQRGNYCAETCGFCQCLVEEDECATCDDISPDGIYSCSEQKSFGKCEEPWMKPFCRRTCGRCNCLFEEDAFAFGVAENSETRVRRVITPLTEVLLEEESEDACPTTLFEVLSQAPQFTLLVEIIKSVGLQSVLEDGNLSVTVFAPVNEAFVDFAEDFGVTLDTFVDQSAEKMMEILQYHVVPFAIKNEKELGDTFSFPTLVPEKRLFGSSSIEVDGIGSSATVIQEGIKICRSVVYTMDEILLPGLTLDDIGPVVVNVPEPQEEKPECNPQSTILETLMKDPDLSAFTQALEDSKISSVLDKEDSIFTLFAPTDDAFEIALAELGITYPELLRDKKTLKSILNYHIVAQNLKSEDLESGKLASREGGKLILAVEKTGVEIAGIGSSANVINADIDDVCTGAVHKIDTTLLPFDIGDEIWAAIRAPGKGTMKPKKKGGKDKKCSSIARVLAQNSNLRVLNNVAGGAGLLPNLADESQSLTIFAPTDAAFYASFLDPETGELSGLLTDPEILKSIMTYHTVNKPLTFKALRPGSKLGTQFSVEGERMKLSVVKRRLSPTGIVLRGEGREEAAIVQKNIVACNSVIHLIDTVLFPFELEESEEEPLLANTVSEA